MKRREPIDVARAALERGDLARAEAECARVLARAPSHAGARSLAVAIAVAAERWEDVLERADKAEADAFVDFARARALLALGRLDEAHAALRRSRYRDPSDPRLSELEAAILRAAGDLPGALHAAEGALALDPHRAPAHTLRAELLELLGRGDEALESLRAAVRKLGRDATHHAAILEHLASMLERRGEAGEAAVARSLAASVAAHRR